MLSSAFSDALTACFQTFAALGSKHEVRSSGSVEDAMLDHLRLRFR
jgi:hypothetical protein